jgi:Zn-dependent oligopeptidase
MANGVQYNNSINEHDGMDGPSIRQSRRQVQLTVDTPISNSLLVYSPSSDLRRDIFLETTTQCPDNNDVLSALTDARHQLATTLEFESYSHRFLQDKMAQKPQNVMTFLTDLQTKIRPHYQQELAIIANAKKRLEGASGTIDDVQPWDIKFYVKALKGAAHTNGDDLAEELAPYLSLTNCLDAMQVLVSELFSITMEELPIGPNERWDIDTDNKSSIPSSKAEQIRKFTFREEDTGRELGIMYLDLHPRPNKYT